jgi:hypothetical protein
MSTTQERDLVLALIKTALNSPVPCTLLIHPTNDVPDVISVLEDVVGCLDRRFPARCCIYRKWVPDDDDHEIEIAAISVRRVNITAFGCVRRRIDPGDPP